MYKDLDAAVQDKRDIVIHLANENANRRTVKEEKNTFPCLNIQRKGVGLEGV